VDKNAAYCALVSDPDELTQLTALFALRKTMDITFTGIPVPPSSNAMYCNSRVPGRRGRVKSREMRMWERDFATWALENAQAFARARAILKTRMKPGYVLQFDATFNFTRERIFTKKGLPKRLDTSNYLKALHDAMAEAIGIDDSWFFDGMMRKRPVGTPLHESATVELAIIESPWSVI
jgi:Holliday junction resolvase RusA-like endonuclease